MDEIDARMKCLEIAIDISGSPSASIKLAGRLAAFVVNGVVEPEKTSDKAEPTPAKDVDA